MFTISEIPKRNKCFGIPGICTCESNTECRDETKSKRREIIVRSVHSGFSFMMNEWQEEVQNKKNRKKKSYGECTDAVCVCLSMRAMIMIKPV